MLGRMRRTICVFWRGAAVLGKCEILLECCFCHTNCYRRLFLQPLFFMVSHAQDSTGSMAC